VATSPIYTQVFLWDGIGDKNYMTRYNSNNRVKLDIVMDM